MGCGENTTTKTLTELEESLKYYETELQYYKEQVVKMESAVENMRTQIKHYAPPLRHGDVVKAEYGKGQVRLILSIDGVLTVFADDFKLTDQSFLDLPGYYKLEYNIFEE